jgi:hypothetical protein
MSEEVINKKQDNQPFSSLFQKVFKLKEKLKHDISTAIN